MTQIAPTILSIGPADHGRRMSLLEFERAVGRDGRTYELSRGVIVVTDVPNPPHFRRVERLRIAFEHYRTERPGEIEHVLAGAECKLLIDPTESERHPDLAVYKTAPPAEDSTVWSIWVPEIVVEVVSADSVKRDYEEKSEDYLKLGVREYWIIDPMRRVVVIHRRFRGKWKLQTLAAAQTYTTPLLPGFELDVAAMLAR